MNSDVKLTLTQEDSHANREGGGEREGDSEIAEVNKDLNNMQCTENMTRKFTNLSFISNTSSSQRFVREELDSHSTSALSGTTLNEEVNEEVVVANECLKLRIRHASVKLGEHKENFQKQLIQFAELL